jgi:hypothetical protein
VKKRFTWVEEMGTYCREYLGDREATWSWTNDWSGFNIPCEVIQQVHELGIIDPNHYDSLMLGIHGLIMSETLHQKAYLIGTCGDEVLDHELTHAMFYVDGVYRANVERIFNKAPMKLREDLIDAMATQNYPRKTAIDEINAYITTGESGYFDTVKDQSELDDLRSKLRSLHRETFPDFIKSVDTTV